MQDTENKMLKTKTKQNHGAAWKNRTMEKLHGAAV